MMHHFIKTVQLFFIAISLGLLSGTLTAGQLEPTATPAPTMKTLDEVEPRIPIPGSDSPAGQFTIKKSGSYYLTGDRVCSDIGIYIPAGVNDVTIDLMGFSLIGVGTNGNSGIRLNGATNVEIRNGTIRGFGWRAIADFNGNASKNNRIIGIRAISNGQYGSGYDGISLLGVGHLIKDCTTAYNRLDGIVVGTACVVIGNISHNNSHNGITAGIGSSITGNACYQNAADGIETEDYCLIDNNTCYFNTTSNLSTGVNSKTGLNVAP